MKMPFLLISPKIVPKIQLIKKGGCFEYHAVIADKIEYRYIHRASICPASGMDRRSFFYAQNHGQIQEIDGISQKVLTDSLRQMMSDGLAYRHDYHEQPPRVEYGLTELGTKMLPIVNSLADFGNYYKSIIEQN